MRDAEAFSGFLVERDATNEENAARAEEDVTAAADAQVFIEGIAVLKLARHLQIPIADESPMCPTLALVPRKPAALGRVCAVLGTLWLGLYRPPSMKQGRACRHQGAALGVDGYAFRGTGSAGAELNGGTREGTAFSPE